LARETDFIVALLNLSELFFPNQTAAAKNGMNWRRQLTNTWQIGCHFVRFDAARCAFDELPIFIGKSRF
jgi:hypothetical protein